MMQKGYLLLPKASILAILSVDFKMDMDSSNGQMDQFIEAIIIMAKEKEMGSFTILRMELLVEDFGKRESLKAKASMLRPKEKLINVSGVKARF